MPNVFDPRQVRRAFSRAAPQYRALAVLQTEVRGRLLEHLDYLQTAPQRVLDLGAGPGEACLAIRKRWPAAQVIAADLALPMLRQIPRGWRWKHPIARLCADAAALPLATGSVDLVYSNLCFQWIDDLSHLLAELRRVLRPGGMLCFSTFATGTLEELRDAFAQAGDAAGHVSPFTHIQQVGDALLHAGFRDPVLDTDRFTLRYADVRGLMQDLRGIGAANAMQSRRRSLTGKQRMQRMVAAYESLRDDGGLPATYEVVYALAWAPPPGQPERAGEGELARFPLEQLRVRRRRQPPD